MCALYCFCCFVFLFVFSVPSEPRFLNATTITSRSVSITWETPENENGVISRYTVDVLTGSTLMNSSNVTQTVFEATSLQPFTNYTFEVAGVTGAGVGNQTSITVLTQEDGECQLVDMVYLSEVLII